MMLNASMFRPYNPSFHNVVAAACHMVGASNMGPFPNRRMYGGDVNNNPPSLWPYQHIHLLARDTTRGDSALDSLRAEAEDVPTDERTIFLTFSKGYPISKVEVKEFFSRFI
ncbi:PREDICTED: CDL15_Pgr025997 [Prunus dulcis]|uniref:PREDICTED: CDL15_Pgr025997 n=1 Tax=Prunus dulcis TaxID=3755 RepID=A0A5E4E9B1_PRUDU|nr:PREDICTED: CDL15_Pgr025997 [Prunus dulcis]